MDILDRKLTSKRITFWKWAEFYREVIRWKSLEFDSRYGEIYKRVHEIISNIQASNSILMLPVLEARIIKLKHLLRNPYLNSRRRSKMASELAQLRNLVRQQSRALEWINSGLPFCVYIQKRFPEFKNLNDNTNPLHYEMWNIARAAQRLFV